MGWHSALTPGLLRHSEQHGVRILTGVASQVPCVSEQSGITWHPWGGRCHSVMPWYLCCHEWGYSQVTHELSLRLRFTHGTFGEMWVCMSGSVVTASLYLSCTPAAQPQQSLECTWADNIQSAPTWGYLGKAQVHPRGVQQGLQDISMESGGHLSLGWRWGKTRCLASLSHCTASHHYSDIIQGMWTLIQREPPRTCRTYEHHHNLIVSTCITCSYRVIILGAIRLVNVVIEAYLSIEAPLLPQ